MITVKSFVTNFFSENTFVVHDDTKEAVLIDCGCIRREEETDLKNYITQNELQLKRYLCTHLHLDHVMGNEFVFNTYGLKPEAHKADVDALPTADVQAKSMGLPIIIRNIPVEKYLIGGEIIAFGHSELQVITVPGHSPGGLAFYNKKNSYVFVGDSLFAGSIGRTDLWGGNQEVLLAAIHNKLLTLPDETIVYCGHGPRTSIYAEKMNNPFL